MTSELLEQRQTILPPGSFGLPIFGELLEFVSDRDFIKKRHKKYGNVFKSKLLSKPVIYVTGGEAVKFVLSNENTYFEAFPVGNFKLLLGENSLSVQTGEVHQGRRRIISKAFASRKLSSYQDTIQDITENYLHRWNNLDEFSWYFELRNYTFDVACKYLLSISQGSKTELGECFRSWSMGLLSIIPPLPFTKSRRALNDRKKLLMLIENIINDRVTDKNLYDDVLSYLLKVELDNGERLTVEEIKDQIILLLFAGHETLTSALSTLCLNLSLNPKILDLCREEQRKCTQSNNSMRMDLSSMPYLDKVLLESLRLVPPVLTGFRKIIRTCNFKNFIFKKDWLIFYNIDLTHYNAEVYSQPKIFDPNNFDLDSKKSLSKSSDYIPFGGGMRECIGKDFAMLELKIFASNLISKYKWELSPDQDLTYNVVPVAAPKDGLKVKFL